MECWVIWVGWGCVWGGGYKYRWGIWETLLDVGLRYKDGELVLEIGGTIPFKNWYIRASGENFHFI